MKNISNSTVLIKTFFDLVKDKKYKCIKFTKLEKISKSTKKKKTSFCKKEKNKKTKQTPFYIFFYSIWTWRTWITFQTFILQGLHRVLPILKSSPKRLSPGINRRLETMLELTTSTFWVPSITTPSFWVEVSCWVTLRETSRVTLQFVSSPCQYGKKVLLFKHDNVLCP